MLRSLAAQHVFVFFLCLWTIQNALGVDVFYDFEDPPGSVVFDKLTNDGAQNGTFLNNVSLDSTQPPFGGQAALFEEPDPAADAPPFSTLEIADTMFDADFALTVAMHVENKEASPDFTRLFTTYQGTGAVPPDRSVFLDFDPTERSGVTGLRAIVNSTVVMTPFAPAGMSDPGYHHYAMTIDGGDVNCAKKAWERGMRCNLHLWNGRSYCLHFRDLPMLAQGFGDLLQPCLLR